MQNTPQIVPRFFVQGPDALCTRCAPGPERPPPGTCPVPVVTVHPSRHHDNGRRRYALIALSSLRRRPVYDLRVGSELLEREEL